MSVKYEIYSDIKSSLEDNVTDIKTIRIWNNQPDNEKKEKPIAYPAVFVEFQNMEWDKTLLNQTHFSQETGYSKTSEQKGIFTIRLHCVFSYLEQETDIFSEMDTLIDSIFQYTQGLKGDYYTHLRRTGETQDTNHNRVVDWIIDYETGVRQCGLKDATLVLIAAGELTPEINTDLDIDNTYIRTGDGEE